MNLPKWEHPFGVVLHDPAMFEDQVKLVKEVIGNRLSGREAKMAYRLFNTLENIIQAQEGARGVLLLAHDDYPAVPHNDPERCHICKELYKDCDCTWDQDKED